MAALISSESQRIGNMLKFEFGAEVGFCRKAVTAYEASLKTYTSGTVLGKTLVSGAATAVAGASNTGNGTMGTITVGASARVGIYTLRVTAASSNAGAFEIRNQAGALVGTGNVASAFVGAGLSFTLADGSTDFAVGDTFNIVVTGTEKYKICEFTASDGSNIPAGIYMGGVAGVGIDTSVAATTDTTVTVLERGPAVVAASGLTLGSSFDSAAKKAGLYARLADLGIIVETQI